MMSLQLVAQESKQAAIEPEYFETFYDDEHKHRFSQGYLLQGKKHGEWIYYYENGKKQEESHFNNGLLSGNVIYWYESGQRKAEGFFKLIYQKSRLESLRDSTYKEWFPNGNLSQKGEYYYGVKNGIWTSYFPEGDKWRVVQYNNGKDHPAEGWNKEREQTLIAGQGIIYDYYDNGPLKSKMAVKDSLYNGMAEYYHSNGNLESEGSLLDGEKNGLWKYYFEGGEKWKHIEYLNGKLDGVIKTWYANGELNVEGKYKNNYKEGEWVWYTKE